jgi:hypothetical protein
MLDQIAGMNEQERGEISRDLSGEEWGLVFGIAESAALRSVRDNDPRKLRYGLLALLVEDLKEDYRESLISLTLLKRSAEKLRVELRDVFDQVKHVGSPRTRELFETYFAEGGKTLADMGYVETTDKDGEFTYKRAW